MFAELLSNSLTYCAACSHFNEKLNNLNGKEFEQDGMPDDEQLDKSFI